jgi:hypothetical protein
MTEQSDVDLALLRLNDAICALERANGGTHTLILLPHDHRRPVHVSLDGKPQDLTSMIPHIAEDEGLAATHVLELAVMERQENYVSSLPFGTGTEKGDDQ